ncbi:MULTISPECIES: response regulator transcription factor [Streptomyces]|uniref:response regulator transcription factor n=1 Tax=Streptomyces TaxID=1883 RepID=UPI001674123E|nr:MULTISPECIES: response regulator transcription factor [Streptomyces]MBD3577603.1 response regulator transcription factor [Streptomyces sp. KD18]GGT09619.1 DNA-binding response regulator [Streptomyces toxytricini]
MNTDVLVHDDLALSRAALTALLDGFPGLTVVGSAASAYATLEFAELHRPDVVLISFGGRDEETVEVAEKIAALPGCRTLLLATACTRPVVRRALAAGIDGMVRRSDPPERLAEAVRRVHRGERVFDDGLADAAAAGGDCPLTRRQLAVLELLHRGDPVPQIAARLSLSEGTARNYVSAVVSAMGARNRIDALRMAREREWI